jgi:HipA-like protein
MARKAKIYNNELLAGTLEKTDGNEYVFLYDEQYYGNAHLTAISLSLPKRQIEFRSRTLFPFFYGLLSEGMNKQTQCRLLRIDENDHFGLLLSTAHSDTIGSVTVKEVSV